MRGLASARAKPISHAPLFLNKAGSTGPRRLDISWPTTEFTKMVRGWDKFDEVKMGIIVRHIKRLVEMSALDLRFTTPPEQFRTSRSRVRSWRASTETGCEEEAEAS